MAGKKGMKGGGGARPGAGRKPNPNRVGPPHRPSLVRVELQDEPCFVYVIYEAEDPCVSKIGVATDVVQRLSSMQVGTWRILKVGHAVKLPSKSAAHAVERQAHQALSALHCRGEWFRVSPDRAKAEVELAADQLRAAFAAAAQLTEAVT